MRLSGSWPRLSIVRPVLVILSLSHFVLGALTNVTVDDVNGDSATGAKVAYFPTGGHIWNNQDQCSGCAILPDNDNAFDKTWTGVTYDTALGAVTATFTFTGTAVYIYFILSNYPASSGLFSDVKCDFAIDGKLAGSYSHISDGTKVFQYNTLVFSKTGLSNGPHTFVILPADNGPLGNYIIFDYARYTTDTAVVGTSLFFAPFTTTSHLASSSIPTSLSTPSTSPSSTSTLSTTSSAPVSSTTASSSTGSSSSSSSATSSGQDTGTISSPPSSGSGASSTASSSVSQSALPSTTSSSASLSAVSSSSTRWFLVSLAYAFVAFF